MSPCWNRPRQKQAPEAPEAPPLTRPWTFQPWLLDSIRFWDRQLPAGSQNS
jgi:hypothetical protein